MYRAISTLYELFLKATFKTYTVDWGKEFVCYSRVEVDLKVPVYFADAYSSWQRGSHENANSLLREFLQKKDDLARVSDEEINEALCPINHRPRKCLGWKTSWSPTHAVVSTFSRDWAISWRTVVFVLTIRHIIKEMSHNPQEFFHHYKKGFNRVRKFPFEILVKFILALNGNRPFKGYRLVAVNSLTFDIEHNPKVEKTYIKSSLAKKVITFFIWMLFII